MKVLVFVLVFELLWDTSMVELFDDEASPVSTVFPPAASLLELELLPAVAEPPSPPSESEVPGAVLSAEPPSPLADAD